MRFVIRSETMVQRYMMTSYLQISYKIFKIFMDLALHILEFTLH